MTIPPSSVVITILAISMLSGFRLEDAVPVLEDDADQGGIDDEDDVFSDAQEGDERYDKYFEHLSAHSADSLAKSLAKMRAKSLASQEDYQESLMRAKALAKVQEAVADSDEKADTLKAEAGATLDKDAVPVLEDCTPPEGHMNYQVVPIPSAHDVLSWVDALDFHRGLADDNVAAALKSWGELPVASQEPPMASNLTSSEAKAMAKAVDVTFRFSMLAYGRNDGKAAVAHVLREASDSTEIDVKLGNDEVLPRAAESAVIELQFHGNDVWNNGAHCVAYIYKLDEGVGVVLAYKGSTSLEDWKHNVRNVNPSEPFGKLLFQGSENPLEVEARVHAGFWDYKESLDARMRNVPVKQLQEILKSWGSDWEEDSASFHQWLHSPNAWKWCAVVGHSLGGAMAQISAAELAVSNKTVLLATVGAPRAGNNNFAKLVNKLVQPSGGLRIQNPFDLVPRGGFKAVLERLSPFTPMDLSQYRLGLPVELPSKATVWAHCFYNVPSEVNNVWSWTKFNLCGRVPNGRRLPEFAPTKIRNTDLCNLFHFQNQTTVDFISRVKRQWTFFALLVVCFAM